ncbi:hypothetical protein AB2S62_00945 [Vibrio sp. NTOU-M3]
MQNKKPFTPALAKQNKNSKNSVLYHSNKKARSIERALKITLNSKE